MRQAVGHAWGTCVSPSQLRYWMHPLAPFSLSVSLEIN